MVTIQKQRHIIDGDQDSDIRHRPSGLSRSATDAYGNPHGTDTT